MFLHFNSIKVRLEQLAQPFRRLRLRFQFHKGTIRTRQAALQEDGKDGDFNSIKVRLEQRQHGERSMLNPHFNSIKVRLEPLFFCL